MQLVAMKSHQTCGDWKASLKLTGNAGDALGSGRVTPPTALGGEVGVKLAFCPRHGSSAPQPAPALPGVLGCGGRASIWLIPWKRKRRTSASTKRSFSSHVESHSRLASASLASEVVHMSKTVKKKNTEREKKHAIRSHLCNVCTKSCPVNDRCALQIKK